MHVYARVCVSRGAWLWGSRCDTVGSSDLEKVGMEDGMHAFGTCACGLNSKDGMCVLQDEAPLVSLLPSLPPGSDTPSNLHQRGLSPCASQKRMTGQNIMWITHL